MEGKILSTLEFHKIVEQLTAKASTSLGKAKAEELLPVSDLEQVKKRLQATDEASAIDRLKGGVPFGGIRDVRAPIRRAELGGTLNPTELLDIATTSQGGRRLRRFLELAAEDHPIPLLVDLASLISEDRSTEERILQCIDEGAFVMDSASQELARVRQELRTGEARVRERLDQMIRTPSVQKMLQDNLVTIRGDRYVIPVKAEYRSHFGGIVHDLSASGATMYIEPEAVVQMNNRLRELRMKEEREVEKILIMLTTLVAQEAEVLSANLAILAELDFIFAKAVLARGMKATLPIMNDRGFLKIKKGRHPLLAKDVVVPLELEIGNHYSSIIVTGPNTGGKTVSLKTVGLLSLMAMSGLFVPAEDDSQLCVFDGIYADIGDEQSIEQNLSTFSSHMTNIISILRGMTPKSLVLLDEVGAGTDPAEGSALAISILDYIHSMGCRLVATTHYSELKAYAYDKNGVINASMEFDVQTLSPTYRLLVGVPGRSNAFAIAERLGLPKRIIDHARGQVAEEDQRVESMIATLEENRLTAEAERVSAESLRREVEETKRKLEEERRRFEEERGKLLVKAEQDAAAAVTKARREAEEVIAELRKLAMEGAKVKEHELIDARRRLDEAVPELAPKRAAVPAKKVRAIEPGDEVMVAKFGQKGTVVDVGAEEATVQLGILKMKVALAELELIKAAPAKQKHVQQATSSIKRTRDENARLELDLRGKNIEDSIIDVDRFLDESFLANFPQVYLIHGKGTGALRIGIQDYLRRHKHVKSFRVGAYNEGGIGVTVVELK
ncbi:endonuclease MutS2 [Gorillibacterium sp. CAU 1737]|uniref:endonuclease MutS2 n=1 Tax=Gorillibacterium sp. CAU 1737 TaxID=3140362 RepID=UPI0032604C92